MVRLLTIAILSIATLSFGDIITQTYNFTPTPKDLGDLEHNSASQWGINLNLSEGEIITGAKLEISNLYNWHPNEWNALYISLLNTADEGVQVFTDYNWGWNELASYNQWGYHLWENKTGKENDYFVSYDGIGIDRINYNNGLFSTRKTDILTVDGHASTTYIEYQENNGAGHWKTETVNTYKAVITFSDSELKKLQSYLEDGNFGFGVDADCHFYNSNFSFSVTTERPTNVPEPGVLSLLGASILGFAFIRRKK
ncbi:MAG TPA: PEP-CTERM sorting domain-containing protein [Chitinispirillaceae bacterium]|nr:PEP-CTERM sorting domain-containing protein [Chitinispirillaceae bacterium]